MNSLFFTVAVFVGQFESFAPTISQDAARDVVVKYMHENANDPKSVEIITITGPYNLATSHYWPKANGSVDVNREAPGAWSRFQQKGVAVIVKYRSKNTYGALELQNRVFAIGMDRKVLFVFSPVAFEPNLRFDKGGDRFFDALLGPTK